MTAQMCRQRCQLFHVNSCRALTNLNSAQNVNKLKRLFKWFIVYSFLWLLVKLQIELVSTVLYLRLQLINSFSWSTVSKT